MPLDNLHFEAERAQEWMAIDQRSEPLSFRASVIGLVLCALLFAATVYGVHAAKAWGLLR